jgi:hypothetical protein
VKAYFCERTGVRLVAPGVSKTIDPVNGVDEYQPAAPSFTHREGDIAHGRLPIQRPAEAGPDEKPAEPSAPTDHQSRRRKI